MVRNYQRKTTKGMHSDIAMRTALDHVRKGMKIRTAAKDTGVDRMTLTRYVEKYGEYDEIPEDINLTSNFNSQQIFKPDQENDLVSYILQRSALGYGLTAAELRECAFEVADVNQINMPKTWKDNKSAGIDWYKKFMKRHPELSARKPEQCSIARAAAFNAVNISNYFDKLSEVIDRHPTFQNRTRVYNLDEKRVSTVGVLKEKIISPKGVKQVHQAKGQERGTSMTMCGIICASGQALPPVLIFPRVNFTNHMLADCYPGTLGLANKAGYMTKELFIPTMKHFIEHSQSSKENPSLLVVDNVGSHLTLEVINLCKDNGVTLFTLPPHTTHKTQPLDVGIFSPFETAYNKTVHQWQQANPGCSATIYNIASYTNSAWAQSATPTNIFSAFKATGIAPFNRDIFPEDAFTPSLVTKDQGQHPSTSKEHTEDGNQKQGEDIPEREGENGAETENDEEELDNPKPMTQSNEFISAVDVLGLPKASTPKAARTNRRKGKCMVATDTPEKNIIEEREAETKRKNDEKIERKRVREEKAKQKGDKKTAPKKRKKKTPQPKNSKRSRRLESESDSDTSDSFGAEETEGGTEDETEEETSVFPTVPEVPEEGQHVLVKFDVQPATKYYVGKIIKNKDANNDFHISYLRKSLKCHLKFVLPNVPDLKIVNIKDILLILPHPTTSGTRRQQNFLEFHEPRLEKLNLG